MKNVMDMIKTLLTGSLGDLHLMLQANDPGVERVKRLGPNHLRVVFRNGEQWELKAERNK